MNSNQLPVSGGLAIFVAVIIGYFVIDPSALDGFRPGGDSSQIEQVHGIEDVQARLWQDPFAAASVHKSKYKKQSAKVLVDGKTLELLTYSSSENKNKANLEEKRHSFQELVRQINIEREESGNKVDVLAVMVSGRPYSEDRETRLRRRYAVIAGLAASGYQPEESTQIGYVGDLGDSDCGEGHLGAGKMPKLMPFEWFKKDGEHKKEDKYSLLLWLDEDAFSHDPLCKLNFLFKEDPRHREIVRRAENALNKIKKQGGKPTREEVVGAYNTAKKKTLIAFSKDTLDRVVIIGPSESGTLKSMLAELPDKKKPDGSIKFPNLESKFFFSATATAEAGQLIKGIGEASGDAWVGNPPINNRS